MFNLSSDCYRNCAIMWKTNWTGHIRKSHDSHLLRSVPDLRMLSTLHPRKNCLLFKWPNNNNNLTFGWKWNHSRWTWYQYTSYDKEGAMSPFMGLVSSDGAEFICPQAKRAIYLIRPTWTSVAIDARRCSRGPFENSFVSCISSNNESLNFSSGRIKRSL